VRSRWRSSSSTRTRHAPILPATPSTCGTATARAAIRSTRRASSARTTCEAFR
jgi:hypothetical protein